MTESQGQPADGEFTAEEALKFRADLREGKRPIHCPRCGKPLGAEAQVAGGGTVGFYWLFRCESCQLAITAGDAPTG